MKNSLTLAVLIVAITSATAGSIKISSGPSIVRRGGQDIPLTFTGTGFMQGTIGNIWIVNARTWQQEDLIMTDVPLNNGVNNIKVHLGWSWYKAPDGSGKQGFYVLRIVHSSGKQIWTSSQVVQTRSAVIWPYPGHVYPKSAYGEVTWVADPFIKADFLRISLLNEDTGEHIGLVDNVDPMVGIAGFLLPDAIGSNYRVCLEGILIMQDPDFESYEIDGEVPLWEDLCEFSQSGKVSLK